MILRVYAPALIGTTCILHSQVVVVSLHCRCIEGTYIIACVLSSSVLYIICCT